MEKYTAAAEKYFNKLDENAKSQAIYRKLLKWHCPEEKKDKAKSLFKKMDHLNFLDSKTPFNDMTHMYYHMKQLDKVKEVYNEIEQRNISRE
ncbi:unnamed protein product [Eruca vesicaria subsp. sativa]|uniref:Uncharacterized protein n=1 Tax=Eruca vesicaria subsp. sativa TaxID=29727 RepID=A0ABC8IW87_ERUVS|nr:unnamed protein product [Eruca vesicaria subsp. sativa]